MDYFARMDLDEIKASIDLKERQLKAVKEVVSMSVSWDGTSKEVPPDKVLIYRDELDRMNRNMAEKDRQTSECYEIMKFEQTRANRYEKLLREIEALIKPIPLYRLFDNKDYALRKVYSLAQKGLSK